MLCTHVLPLLVLIKSSDHFFDFCCLKTGFRGITLNGHFWKYSKGKFELTEL